MFSFGCLLVALAGCAQQQADIVRALPPPAAGAVVFVCDGAGNLKGTSGTLRELIARDCLPLQVETVHWSHGYGRIVSDQIDYRHAKEEGAKLAGEILAVRQCRPDLRIYLLAHSAGSAVVLSATRCLPPDTVEGIVLLAPSVSADYDLRPALACSRKGVDVFTSERDVIFLGVGAAVVGTADRKWRAPAGRVGFRPAPPAAPSASLYAKLREHPWTPEAVWAGNLGGHRGSIQPEYMRRYVVPLLLP